MTARAEVIGAVDGEVLLTGPVERPVVSFVLADDQRALSDDGLIVRVRVAWCQVICQSADTAEAAGSLRSGIEVAVRGELSVLRATPASQGSDAVLVSLMADSVQILGPAH